jgi:F-type H+-transporting ATPase subunit delta
VAQLSDRYATALFALSIERGATDAYLAEATFIRDALLNDEWQPVITHPQISKERRCAFFTHVFGDQVSGDFIGFLHLTVAKNREPFIIPALNAFIEMVNRHQRRTTATVMSAAPLRPEQLDAIARMLGKKLNKQVNVVPKVDEGLIGGVRIQVDGYFIENTVKQRLSEAKAKMIKNVV